MGRGSLELAQTLLRVALAWHTAGSSTPKDLRVNNTAHQGFVQEAVVSPIAWVFDKEGTEVVHLELRGYLTRKGPRLFISSCVSV